MTQPLIAAQEQRLRRIAEIARIPRADRTIEQCGLLVYLSRVVRRDALTYGGPRP